MSWSIAIIDQGIEAAHDRLQQCTITGITIRKTATGFEKIPEVFSDDTGHGTAVAAIIHRMAPSLPLVAVKLSSFDNRLSEDLLVHAIAFCLTKPDVQLINISMGIPALHPSAALIEVCEQARQQQVMIVAASYNFPNTSCYPAHLPSVYGVSTGLVNNKFEYGYNEGPINILAKGTTQRVANRNNSYRITSGTSFATAHFSGIAAHWKLTGLPATLETWDQLIRQHATENIQPLLYFRDDNHTRVYTTSHQEFDEDGRDLFTFQRKLPFAQRLALFPVSEKEMKTVLEFREQCRFEVTCLIDYPVRLISRERSAANTLNLEVIRDIGRIDPAAFDTLVLGYCLDQLADANIAFAIRLIRQCVAHNKHFICWDADVYELVKKLLQEKKGSTSQVYVTRVTSEHYTAISEYQNLPYCKTPVIAVVGTSNRQGKITAQLRLRKILEEEGYKVSHISTEPQGLLLGADFIFPCGYKNPIEPPESEWGRLMRIVLRGVQRYNKPDVIITGIQNGLLPRTKTISNEFGHDLAQLHYLLGVQPDAICCGINPDDDPELIRNTIQVMKSYCKSQLLFCFVTPWSRNFLPGITGDDRDPRDPGLMQWQKLEPAQLQERIQYFREQLSVPVIDIMDTSINSAIIKMIQDAFSEPVPVPTT